MMNNDKGGSFFIQTCMSQIGACILDMQQDMLLSFDFIFSLGILIKFQPPDVLENLHACRF
jgi:hypothetical protein